MSDELNYIDNVNIDRQYYYTQGESLDKGTIPTGLYEIQYITFYSLNRGYIWGTVLFLFFIGVYYLFLFSIYLRTMGYKNNIATPFSTYDYDLVPSTNYINHLYWNQTEHFEGNTKRKKTDGNGILANIQKWINMALLLPKSIWKMEENIQKASTNINREIGNRINPYYDRFVVGMNKTLQSL